MALYRTFVQLDPYEKWILRMFQHALTSQRGKKVPLSTVISAIIREAWQLLVDQSDPSKIEELKNAVPAPKEIKLLMKEDGP